MDRRRVVSHEHHAADRADAGGRVAGRDRDGAEDRRLRPLGIKATFASAHQVIDPIEADALSKLGRENSPPVVVHLVPGTWPYGLFRYEPPDGPPTPRAAFFQRTLRFVQLRPPAPRWTPAWFDDHSPVRARIRRLAGCPVEFRVFRWRWCNSVATRHRAAHEFYRYLVAAAAKEPERTHVILAHSHGGTVVAKALSPFSQTYSDPAPQIKAVVCLAAPFVYLTYQEKHEREEFASAVGGVLLMSITLVLLAQWQTFAGAPGWALLLFQFFAVGFTQQLASWLFARDDGKYRSIAHGTIPDSMPTFVLRGTRDEASLSIGLAQSIHALTNFVYASEDTTRVSWMRKGFILALLLPLVLVIVADHVTFGDFRMNNMLRWVALAIIVGNGLAGLLRCLGFGALAAAVGYWDVRGWGCNSIEVDAVPPAKDCMVRSYFDMEPDAENPDVVRHGIYDHPEVQTEIAAIIRAVAAGEPPRLRTAQELEEAADWRRNRRGRLFRLRERRAKTRTAADK